MRYTVVWHADARDDLAELWLAASDRRNVTAAADQIDRELAVNPEQKGQQFYGDWFFEISPLCVIYSISPDDQLVEVLQIWRR
jgi:hypothetical protein